MTRWIGERRVEEEKNVETSEKPFTKTFPVVLQRDRNKKYGLAYLPRGNAWMDLMISRKG
jgi:hypothetical protein